LQPLYNPVSAAGVKGPYDFALVMWQVRPWLVVVLSVLGEGLIAF